MLASCWKGPSDKDVKLPTANPETTPTTPLLNKELDSAKDKSELGRGPWDPEENPGTGALIVPRVQFAGGKHGPVTSGLAERRASE